MSSFPHNHNFQQFLHQNPSQPQQSNLFRDFNSGNNNMDGGQIAQHQVAYFNNNNPNLIDQQHPPYIQPCLALGQGLTNNEIELNLQWVDSKKKAPIERLFLENNINLNGSSSKNNHNNNSQLSDLFQARSVSTGLGLSLENPRLSSSGDSALSGLIGDALEQELQRQDAEIDRYVKVQGDRLRQAILGKFQANQLQTISYIEEKVAQKLREKDSEMEETSKKNLELELRLEQLTMEANTWQQRAKYGENMISALKQNLQQVYAQSRDSKEGCGDSEVADTASCCNGHHPMDFHLLRRDGGGAKETMTCKVCRVNDVCMLLLPCKHLCLCKECESKLSVCPLCNCSKYLGMEVYM